MASTITAIGRAYSTSMAGSTSIPTDTKNTAPKRFFTGSTTLIIFSASTVSAKILPITNAPKALENPTCVEMTAIRQHNPSDTTRRVSSLMSLRTERKNIGMSDMPTTNHRMRKKPMRSTLPIISPPSGLLPLATADSITIITIARTSSNISTLITSEAKCCCRSPMSSKALYMIVVELIASIPARKMQSI